MQIERTLKNSLIPRTPPAQLGLRIVECGAGDSRDFDSHNPATSNGVERQQSVYGLIVGGDR